MKDALGLSRMPLRVAIASLTGAVAVGTCAAAGTAALGWWTPTIPATLGALALIASSVAAAIGGAAATYWWSRREVRDAEARSRANEQVHADAAERTLMEASQRNAYAAVGDFATELAREITPSVASARTAMRSLESLLHLDSPLRTPLERAQRELHRLANTMQDTLRLARSGKLSMRRIDLWVPLRNALKTATPDASSRRIWIEPPKFGREPIWINGDEQALEQLFLNLLLNAVQETDSGGRISAAVTIGDDALVSIADTGRGIPQDALDRVFEPFFTTKTDGAGLGLAIAWRTAAAHGGRLSIESALGRGTTVEVALPRADGGAMRLTG
jgi:two-component system sensor histidine kinase HydH